jgi:hypothetical protein
MELFQSGGIAVIDNYKTLKSYGFRGLSNKKLFSQNKGIDECAKAFINSIENNHEHLISFDVAMEVSKISIAASEQILRS